MAERTVVREDVVQIRWEVEANPFDEINQQVDDLVGDANRATDELNHMAREAKQVSGGLGEASQQTQQLAGGTQRASKPFSRLAREMAQLDKTKLKDPLGSLKANVVDGITSSVAKLKRGFAGLRNVRLKDVTSGLKSGLDAAVRGAKSLYESIKRVAGVSLHKLKSALSGLGSAAGSAAKALGTGIGKVGKAAVRGLGTAMKGLAVGAAAAGAGIYKFTDMASDLNEAQNVVEATFGDAASAQMSAWADGMAQAAGISKTSATQWVGTMGALMKASGVAQAQLPKMSQDMVQLAGDLASFYNLDTEDAFDKLRQGISGETEGLKQLGINMSQTNLETFMASDAARAMGVAYGKSFQTLSQGEQAQLRYAYLMSVTKDAQGDFLKTQDGFANQMRVAQLQVKSMAQNLGQLFLPALGKGAKAFNRFAGEINHVLSDGWQAGDADKLVDIVMDMVDQAAQAIQKGLPKLIAGLTKGMNVLIGALVKLIPKIAPVLVKGAIQLLKGFIDTIRQNAKELAGVAAELIAEFALFLMEGIPALIETGLDLILALAEGMVQNLPKLIDTAMKALLSFINGLMQRLPMLLQAAMQIIQTLIQGLLEHLPQIIDAGLKLLLGLAQGIIDNIPQIAQAAIQVIQGLLRGIIQNLPQIVQAGIDLLVSLAMGIVQAIPALIAMIPELFGSLIQAIFSINWLEVGWNIIKAIGEGIWNGIKGIGTWIGDALSGLFGGGDDMSDELSHAMTQMSQTQATECKRIFEDQGEDAAMAYAKGLQSQSAQVLGASQQVALETQAGLAGIDPAVPAQGVSSALTAMTTTLQQQGIQNSVLAQTTGNTTAAGLAAGLNAGVPQVQGAASNLESAAQAAQTGTITLGVTVDTGGFAVVSQQFDELKARVSATLQAMLMDTNGQMTQLAQAMGTGAQQAKTAFEGVDLHASGVQMMNGLQAGLNSKRGALLATARSIANGIAATMNNALKVHSPSRVTMETGQNVALGAVQGMRQTMPQVRQAASAVSDSIVGRTGGRVGELFAGTRTAHTEQNTYSPQFVLTMQGTSDRDTERKVKRWIRESLDETFESMGRKRPRLTGV